MHVKNAFTDDGKNRCLHVQIMILVKGVTIRALTVCAGKELGTHTSSNSSYIFEYPNQLGKLVADADTELKCVCWF